MITEVEVISIISSKLFGDFVSKAVSDGVDMLKNAIKNADKDRKSGNYNLQANIYIVILDALNQFTYNKYNGKDELYDIAERILKAFISGKNNIEAVSIGLKTIDTNINDGSCLYFLNILCYVICKDNNSVLYKQLDMLWKWQESNYYHAEFEKNDQNHKEMFERFGEIKEDTVNLQESIDNVQDSMHEVTGLLHTMERHKEECISEILVANRAEEYAEKWNKNVFLNNFKKRDKKKGENIKLREIYLEEHLPHYVSNVDDEPSDKLRDLLSEYIVDRDDKKMLLILGQPGIGKSTLITWIMANLVEKKDDIFVYQFASDLENVNWQGDNILNDIFKTLGLRDDDLKSKVLILDGFDEIHTSKDRKDILNQLFQKLLGNIKLRNFSLIVTCREKYIYDLPKVECDYITLQRWNEIQIESFCRTYAKISTCNISQNKINKILENRKIFGIPLILYMILALDISIEENSSIVDIYDHIFSIDGGSIYDRCIKTSRYEPLPHRIGETKIKQQIHLISQGIAFWIFENEPEEAFITKEKYEKICDDIIIKTSEKNEDIKRDVLIANYFESIKHCDGIGTDELQFVHRSIYEYFVAVYFFESLSKLKSVQEVSEKAGYYLSYQKLELAAGELGKLLKKGRLSIQILEFVKYKFDSMKGFDRKRLIS